MEDTTSKKIYIEWGEIHELVNILCERIPIDAPLADSIHGLSRGGLIPAVIISHQLDIPYTDTINKNTLVIDDICDTGKTLNESPGWMHAVLHYKPTANFTPLCWGKEIGEEWIVYPWEREDSKPIQDYLK